MDLTDCDTQRVQELAEVVDGSDARLEFFIDGVNRPHCRLLLVERGAPASPPPPIAERDGDAEEDEPAGQAQAILYVGQRTPVPRGRIRPEAGEGGYESLVDGGGSAPTSLWLALYGDGRRLQVPPSPEAGTRRPQA